MSEVRIGTSGWSYPGGKGTWKGIFYPHQSGTGRGSEFDELAFYAEHFNTVEINSTFYRVPTPEAAVAGPNGRRRLRVLGEAVPEVHAPGDVREATGADPFDLNQTDVDAFRTGIEPLASAGKLGALLAQFPPSFKNDRDTRGYLVAPAGVLGLPDRGRTAAPDVERRRRDTPC